MKISVIVPVYNEADSLDACLSAIGKLRPLPFEVIVVDNNSTDDSAAIAKSYPFVTVLREKQQGVVHARSRGFDAARGDIIGRIDADTIVDPDWTHQIEKIFADSSVDAVSGSIDYYRIPFRRFIGFVDLFFRTIIAWGMGEEMWLYGANMAMRRSLWLKTRSALCNSGGMHEDFDLAIHAYERGGHIIFNRQLHANVSARRINTNFIKHWEYVWLSPKTYSLHGRTSQRHMYSACITVIIFYLPLKLGVKSYDPLLERMTLARLFSAAPPVRVNPASFVD